MEKTLQVLNELERKGIMSRYAIAGAMGATFYAEPVLTFDLDVIVLLPQMQTGLLTLTPLYDALRAKGYAEEAECVVIEEVPVQFLPAYLVEEALREAVDTQYYTTPTRSYVLSTYWRSPFKPVVAKTGNASACCGNKP